MIPAAFAYQRPAKLDEALELLDRHGADAKLLAGGQTLIPLLRFRLASPERLIDIGRIAELRGIERDGNGWRIGAATTYTELLEHAELAAAYPILPECVARIGDMQVRNRGTIGGSLAHADPVSDIPALALALDAEVTLRSRGGERRMPVADFLESSFTTALAPNELLTAVHLPALPAGAGSAWSALEQAASGYSIVGVAAVVGDVHGILGKGTINHVRVAITGVSDVAYRATEVEDALTGTSCSADDLRPAAARGVGERAVISDIHADEEYRRALAEVHVRRALERALARLS
jgi:aerobic carbon-monoxide dehydrogenase medium subunit